MRTAPIVFLALLCCSRLVLGADIPNLDGVICGPNHPPIKLGAVTREECLAIQAEDKSMAESVKDRFGKDEMARCEKAARTDPEYPGYGALWVCLATTADRKRQLEIAAAFGTKEPTPSRLYCEGRWEGGYGMRMDVCLAYEERCIRGAFGFVEDATLARCIAAARQKHNSWAVLQACVLAR
jgi:hypothetical protein